MGALERVGQFWSSFKASLPENCYYLILECPYLQECTQSSHSPKNSFLGGICQKYLQALFNLRIALNSG